jgi:serine/threonine protein kinase
MAEGLAYAHRNGIVHADLKPGNIFVTNDNLVKLLDFGIARAIPAFAAKQKNKDIFDAVSLGAYTATYATAEMMQAGDPDPADDVYGLGLIAYEVLTGHHPYQRYSAVEAQQKGLIPAPIKGLTQRQWRVLERSLRFARSERQRDASQFLRELSGITRVQQIMIAGLATLALTAGFFAYQSYQEGGPAIAFNKLPTATQQQFNAYLTSGNELWRFYEQDHNLLALQDAIDQYAKAYNLHPRNRTAVAALRRAADSGLQSLAAQPEQQHELARIMSERSDYLASYEPVRAALK